MSVELPGHTVNSKCFKKLLGFMLFLKEVKQSEGFAQIFVHYLFFSMGQIKLSMDRYLINGN